MVDTMKDIVCALFDGVIFTLYYLYDVLSNIKYLENFF